LARRRHSVFVKHFAAMQLLLSMQDEKGNYPNVGYVKDHPEPEPVKRIFTGDIDPPPPQKDPDVKFRYLRDMFILVDRDVYKAFHRMLQDPLGEVRIGRPRPEKVNEEVVKNNAKENSIVLQRTNELFGEIRPKDPADPAHPDGIALWECPPPHPIPVVIHEVIAELLADRLD
jgi:hypothetical protein